MEITLLPFETGDIEAVLEWNSGAGADFLTQWAGSGYVYPLTYEQVRRRLDTGNGLEYHIFALREAGETVGTIEINFLNMKPRSAMICRFLLAPGHRRRGLGVMSLLAAEDYARKRLGLRLLRLKVFEYNRPAVNCYNRAGYMIYNVAAYANGLPVLEMEKKIN
ncbi:MAG: GNAT family N-acetyltransferase [Defluviitaleaceae bacterium]|nr:GNAT family N-acetyltransferase [Defluviitaleaceae bacterium]